MYVYRDLIDVSTGRVNRKALKAMARRRMDDERLAGHHCTLADAISHYRGRYEALSHEWRAARGLPVDTVSVALIGWNPVGVAREA